jgi:hypothetical protein
MPLSPPAAAVDAVVAPVVGATLMVVTAPVPVDEGTVVAAVLLLLLQAAPITISTATAAAGATRRARCRRFGPQDDRGMEWARSFTSDPFLSVPDFYHQTIADSGPNRDR